MNLSVSWHVDDHMISWISKLTFQQYEIHHCHVNHAYGVTDIFNPSHLQVEVEVYQPMKQKEKNKVDPHKILLPLTVNIHDLLQRSK